MRFVILFFVMTLFLQTCVPLSGQEPAESGVAEKNSNQEKSAVAEKKLDTSAHIQLSTTILKSMFGKIEMSDEQKARIFKIIETSVPEIAAANAKLKSILTNEQRKEYNSHFRMGRLGKFTIEHAKSYALKRMELPKDVRVEYLKAEQQARFHDMKFNNEIASLLTAEQKEKLPMFDRDKKKTFMCGLILPNMETADDVELAKDKLATIKDLEIVKVLLDQNTIKMEFEEGAKLRDKLKEFVDAGHSVFADFSFDRRTGDYFDDLANGRYKPKENSNGEAGSDSIEKSKDATDEPDKPESATRNSAEKENQNNR